MEEKKGILAGLEPERVFYWFEKLCAIPHGSGNVHGVTEFLLAFALEVAAAMAEGSAKLLLSSDESAGSLVKKVCSPGGTTIEGVRTPEDAHFSDLVADAFSASLRRDRELSQLS